jgi:hypothetical protein
MVPSSTRKQQEERKELQGYQKNKNKACGKRGVTEDLLLLESHATLMVLEEAF